MWYYEHPTFPKSRHWYQEICFVLPRSNSYFWASVLEITALVCDCANYTGWHAGLKNSIQACCRCDSLMTLPIHLANAADSQLTLKCSQSLMHSTVLYAMCISSSLVPGFSGVLRISSMGTRLHHLCDSSSNHSLSLTTLYSITI